MTSVRGAVLAAVALWLCCAHAPEPRWIPASSALNLVPVGPVAFAPGQLTNRVLLVNFFATWCAPCLAELPALTELQAAYGKRGFTAVAVGLDREGARVLEPFANFYRFEFPVLIGDDAFRAGTTPFGRIPELPATFLIARDGHLIAAFGGTARSTQLAPLVEKAIAEQ